MRVWIAAVMSFLWLAHAGAQSFPSKPIRLLVPFPPGGPTDQVSRLVGQKITESTGQPILVDNRPGGGSQIATGGHLLAEMFKSATGAPLVHVPYKGSAPAMQDLIAGQVDLLFDLMGAGLPQARGAKAKLLAVGTRERSPRAPEVPTMAEAGYPDVVMTVWFGIVAKSGTLDSLVRTLNGHIVSALNSPEVSKRLYDQGFDPSPSTPEEFGAQMRSEREKWGAVVKSSGARVD